MFWCSLQRLGGQSRKTIARRTLLFVCKRDDVRAFPWRRNNFASWRRYESQLLPVWKWVTRFSVLSVFNHCRIWYLIPVWLPMFSLGCFFSSFSATAFSALTLLFRRQEGHPACKKLSGGCWRDADLHMAQLMPLPLTVSCFSKIQIGFTFLVPAHPGSPGKRAVKWVCVRACVCFFSSMQCVGSWTLVSNKRHRTGGRTGWWIQSWCFCGCGHWTV